MTPEQIERLLKVLETLAATSRSDPYRDLKVFFLGIMTAFVAGYFSHWLTVRRQEEKRKLEESFARNAQELERAQREREVAEAARRAAAQEAEKIVAEYKAAHDKLREKKEAELRKKQAEQRKKRGKNGGRKKKRRRR